MSAHEIEQYEGHTIVYDEENGSWGAYVEDVPVCFTVGDTFEECQQRIRSAIAGHLDALRRDQQDRPWLYRSDPSTARIG